VDFSTSQLGALDAIATWLKGSKQVFRLFGYAGTGKTSLAKYLHADYYAAYTGKAAHVMNSKGCYNATTIHRLIYVSKQKSVERLNELIKKLDANPNNEAIKKQIIEERRNLNRPFFTLNLDSPLRFAKLLVIDECSMVDEQMGKDVLSFGCKVLVLGDPFQLPPVRGGGFFTETEPDVLLTEPHRFAKDQPIYRIATNIREGLPIKNDPQVVRRMTPELACSVDQIIVGKNVTRQATNKRMRELLGFSNVLPVVGDKLVCTRNNHDLGIYNGAMYNVTAVDTTFGLCMEIQDPNNGTKYDVCAHAEYFEGKEPHDIMSADCFEFGYGITCHKAQGSQWDKVAVVDESHVFKNVSARWLYTAATRAAKELTIAG
jgi:exodeoxyribonuclease-5